MNNKEIIKSCEVKVLDLPLKKQWKISLYSQNTRPHAIVKLTTESGIVGYGEAAPSPAFMGETGYTMELAINKYLGSAVIGEDVFNVDSIHKKMDTAIYGNFAAKSSIDIALYDIMGKLLNVPVYKLIGGKCRDKVSLSWVVGMQDINSAIEEAGFMLDKGYKVLKVKVGHTPKEDYELIKRIRDELGWQFSIRLDANQGYDYQTALNVFSKLEEFDLESIEQPVRRWDINGMKMLRERLSTPIMADESASDFHSAMNVVKNNACDIINIKVGKVGGLTFAKKIATYLEAEGLKGTAGSNLEVGIGSAASIHFVASTANVDIPNDLMLGGVLHKYDIIEDNLLIEDGYVNVPEKPGLGIEVDESIFK